MSEISLFNRPQAFNWKQNRLRLPRVLNKSPFIKADGATNHKHWFVEFSEKKKKKENCFQDNFSPSPLKYFSTSQREADSKGWK